MDDINVVRIDDGCRAKIVCERCGHETYVNFMLDPGPTPIEFTIQALTEVRDSHVRNCRG